MTGGDPPQPSVAVNPEQILLAQRLVAKELLRKCFHDNGYRWSNFQGIPDSHGEFGPIEDMDSIQIQNYVVQAVDKLRNGIIQRR